MVVNLHGALISTPIALIKGMKIEIQVYFTGKRAGPVGVKVILHGLH